MKSRVPPSACLVAVVRANPELQLGWHFTIKSLPGSPPSLLVPQQPGMWEGAGSSELLERVWGHTDVEGKSSVSYWSGSQGHTDVENLEVHAEVWS